MRKYPTNEARDEARRLSGIKYRQSEKGRAKSRAHVLSGRKLENQRKWFANDKGKVCLNKYNLSEKGKAAKRRFHGRPTPTRPMPEFCECCGDLPNGLGKLHEDHDHVTGKFRGWLCHSCNTALGHLGDTLIGVFNAIRYLKRNEDSIDV